MADLNKFWDVFDQGGSLDPAPNSCPIWSETSDKVKHFLKGV